MSSKPTLPTSQPRQPVLGLESEFSLYVRDEKRKPEHVFQNPQQIVRAKMMRREGRSFHMPSGGAVYFDTGVIEVATPIIEIEPGCCIRGVRSLWEQIEFLRGELDAWETANESVVRLEGFSTHYNISLPMERPLDARAAHRFALLLTYIVAVPAMILTANRQSSGIGVRPRGNRVEITADFTTDPELMMAAAALIAGLTLAVAEWPSHSLDELRRRAIPVIAGFRPRKHTSRKGWLARFDCFPRNPFTADLNAADWVLTDGRTVSLRAMAAEIAAPFKENFRAVSDAACYEHFFAVLDGRARSLLDFAERPRRYEDVGRQIDWHRRSTRVLPRSSYEKVIHRVLEGRAMKIGRASYRPERMQGWYEIVFRNVRTGRRRVFNLDDLARRGG